MTVKTPIMNVMSLIAILLAAPAVVAETITSPIIKSDNVAKDSIEQQPTENLWNKFSRNVSKTWDSDQYDLYIPTITWHNRLTYDKEKTDHYNERPWGVGFGKSRYDEDNDWHSLYVMAFKDSHNKWEPIIGYGYQKMWGDLDGLHAGAGFTLSVTARDDYKYIPMPLPLPLVSVEYNKLAFQATYIPGTYNNGNVFFAWLRWQF